ncbi:Tn3 family transposase [Ktedonobacter robiniae]
MNLGLTKLESMTFDQVNTKLITDQWNEMWRVASSIHHGTVSASLLMRKLAAYPRQNQVARALTELGKLERTVFLLEYFRDAEWILKQDVIERLVLSAGSLL